MTQEIAYEKLDEDEVIEVGDILELENVSNKVKLAKNTFKRNNKQIIRSMYQNRK